MRDINNTCNLILQKNVVKFTYTTISVKPSGHKEDEIQTVVDIVIRK